MKLVLLFLLDGQRFPVDLPKLVLCLESLRLKSGLILYFVLGVGLGEKGPRGGMGHVFMDRKRDQAARPVGFLGTAVIGICFRISPCPV